MFKAKATETGVGFFVLHFPGIWLLNLKSATLETSIISRGKKPSPLLGYDIYGWERQNMALLISPSLLLFGDCSAVNDIQPCPDAGGASGARTGESQHSCRTNWCKETTGTSGSTQQPVPTSNCACGSFPVALQSWQPGTLPEILIFPCTPHTPTQTPAVIPFGRALHAPFSWKDHGPNASALLSAF